MGTSSGATRHERVVEIANELGLHARAAAKFVQTATMFESSIKVRSGELEVDGKSIMGVLLLAASKGTQITVIAAGPDAEAALDALEELVAQRFGEDE